MKRLLVVCLLLGLGAGRAGASGFVENWDDLAPGVQPADPGQFLDGDLGIVSESLWPRWRALAFRVMAGAPIDAETRSALVGKPADGKTPSSLQAWQAARQAVPGVPVPAHAPNAQYGYDFENCYADAFATATKTLGERIQRFGSKSKEVHEWLVAQDVVFGNCDTSAKVEVPIPPDKVPAGIDAVIQKDRDYQVAAAHFYARQFPEAHAAFERVAADRASPWSGWGRFVAARTLLRQATSGPANDLAMLGEAEKQLTAVLADPKATALHASARRLVRFVAYRTRPDAQLLALGELVTKGGGDDFDLVVTDLAFLADQKRSPLPLDELDKTVQSELVEWTLAWQLEAGARATRALERYRQKKTMPWLLLALASVPPGHADAKPLLEDARRIKAGTPGYVSTVYYRARLLVAQQRLPAARSLLDELLAQKALGREARNRLLDLRYPLARTVDEALGLMVRFDGSGHTVLAATVAPVFLQYLPLAESVRAAQDPRLPVGIRLNILHAAWLRAALVDEVKLAATIALALRTADPSTQAWTAPWLAAKTTDERRFVLVHHWLRSKGLLYLPDYGGDGATCATSAPALRPPSDGVARPAPAFIDATLRAKARAESDRLTALVGEPATYRARQVSAWARSHPDDARVPEDLHYAVFGTKHACDGKVATAASKEAWKTLHDLFPKNDWTRETKYWYP